MCTALLSTTGEVKQRIKYKMNVKKTVENKNTESLEKMYCEIEARLEKTRIAEIDREIEVWRKGAGNIKGEQSLSPGRLREIERLNNLRKQLTGDFFISCDSELVNFKISCDHTKVFFTC